MNLNLKKPKLICYDWDNTLASTLPVAMDALNIIFTKYQKPLVSKNDEKKIAAINFNLWFAEIFDNKATEVMFEYNILYKSMQNKIKLFDDVENFLKQAQLAKIKQIVISNKSIDLVETEVEQANVRKYFDAIITPDNSGYFKPHSSIFEFALQKIEFNSEQLNSNDVWYFGDSYVDIDFAVNMDIQLFLFDKENAVLPNYTQKRLLDSRIIILDREKNLNNNEKYKEMLNILNN